MPAKDNFQGVSNCYVFKSRLQEYAQKVGHSTPVYETIKEGPSHEPTFNSTVIVNDVRYDSLPGFSNRKAAEQSAAEVALMELSKSSDLNPHVSPPVHETGLCKNLLQEYAQKMNYAIPQYLCQKDDGPSRAPHFSCTVDIGGIRYIGAVAKTKKEAEIKAARTALLAIQSCPTSLPEKFVDRAQLTVIPGKKKEADCSVKPKITIEPRTNNDLFKKVSRKRGSRNRRPNLQFNIDRRSTLEPFATGVVQVPGFGEPVELAKDTNIDRSTLEPFATGVVQVPGFGEPVELAEDTNIDRSTLEPFATGVVQVPGFGEPVELAEDTNIDRSTLEPFATGVVQVPGFGKPLELAKDAVQNSEFKMTNLSSSDDNILVSNIQSDMPPPVNGNLGALSSDQMNCATSDVMSFPLSNVQPTCGEVGNVADMPSLVNGHSSALSSNQMNCATSDVMSLPLSDVQPTCGEVGNVATGVTGEGELQ